MENEKSIKENVGTILKMGKGYSIHQENIEGIENGITDGKEPSAGENCELEIKELEQESEVAKKPQEQKKNLKKTERVYINQNMKIKQHGQLAWKTNAKIINTILPEGRMRKEEDEVKVTRTDENAKDNSESEESGYESEDLSRKKERKKTPGGKHKRIY